jgi:hypothetical protein
MNAAEARETVGKVSGHCTPNPRMPEGVTEVHYGFAVGYLAALQGPEVTALAKIVDDLDYVFTNIGHPSLKGIYQEFAPRCKEALAAFKKAVNP